MSTQMMLVVICAIICATVLCKEFPALIVCAFESIRDKRITRAENSVESNGKETMAVRETLIQILSKNPQLLESLDSSNWIKRHVSNRIEMEEKIKSLSPENHK